MLTVRHAYLELRPVNRAITIGINGLNDLTALPQRKVRPKRDTQCELELNRIEEPIT